MVSQDVVMLNDTLAEWVAANADRFAWIGSVPLTDAAAAAGELERTVALGACGDDDSKGCPKGPQAPARRPQAPGRNAARAKAHQVAYRRSQTACDDQAEGRQTAEFSRREATEHKIMEAAMAK